jgi:hypothetical protein
VHNGKGETRKHDEGKSMISLKLEMIEGLKTKSCCQYLEPRLLATQIYSNTMQQTQKGRQATNVYFLKIIETS